MKSPKGNKPIKTIKFMPHSTITVNKSELPVLYKEKQLKNIITNPDSVLNNSFYKEIYEKYQALNKKTKIRRFSVFKQQHNMKKDKVYETIMPEDKQNNNNNMITSENNHNVDEKNNLNYENDVGNNLDVNKNSDIKENKVNTAYKNNNDFIKSIVKRKQNSPFKALIPEDIHKLQHPLTTVNLMKSPEKKDSSLTNKRKNGLISNIMSNKIKVIPLPNDKLISNIDLNIRSKSSDSIVEPKSTLSSYKPYKRRIFCCF